MGGVPNTSGRLVGVAAESAVAGAPDEEVEITPAMIDAGVTELSLCESSDSWWSTAEAVYRAMELARRRHLG